MVMIDIDTLVKKLYSNHPDKMILDDMDDFTRGRLVGHIEIIMEIEAIAEEGDIDETRE